jgi:hypothetical protein
VNGDGYADVIIGAQDEDPGDSPQSAGRAYVFAHTIGASDDPPSGPVSPVLMCRPYPNPSTGLVTVLLHNTSTEPHHAELSLWSPAGRQIDGTVRHTVPAMGAVRLRWSAKGNTPPGLYWLRLRATAHQTTQPVVLIR